MLTAAGHHGVEGEVLFEQRTPSTLRGFLTLTTDVRATTARDMGSPQRVPTYPRNLLWRLRIGEGSTMLCSKLCGILTVHHPDDVAEEKITITLAVRSSTPTASMDSMHTSQSDGSALHLPPIAPPGGAPQIPAWVRRTSKLKVQWIELSSAGAPITTSSSSGGSRPPQPGAVTLDLHAAHKALQTATRDRSLLESMFRTAGTRVLSADVQCAFSDSPLSARGTSKFASMRSTASPISGDFDGSQSGMHSIANTSRGGSPTPMASPNKSSQRQRSTARAPNTTSATDTLSGAGNGSVASQPPVYQKPFWLGFIVGCSFGVTAVLAMMGQTGRLTEVARARLSVVKELVSRGADFVSKYRSKAISTTTTALPSP